MTLDAVALMAGLLAVGDAGLSGFRAVCGRRGELELRTYYLRSIRLAMGLSVLAFLLLYFFLRFFIWLDLVDPASVGRCLAEMLKWYGPGVAMLILAFGVYKFGSEDLRTLATVVVLGPLTLLRPLLIMAGAISGAWASQSWLVSMGVLAGVAWLLGLERIVSMFAPYRHSEG
ncbi:MAG: hypothetical protein IPL79_15425 [Myxococcales bacterium]|nr:hypothetical protein [Myxococcales bacterium]